MSDEMLPVNHVRVGERHRKDMGDIEALAESIRTIGLLNPVIVDKDNNLVAGERRLTAIRKLGWPNVPVRRVRQITDAITALIAERDENTCRENFKPSESVALGMALEEMERPAAEARKAAAQAKPGERVGERVGDGDSPSPTAKGPVRNIVAPAVGMKPSRYAHAKAVVVEKLSHANGGVNGLLGKAEQLRRQTGHYKAHCVAAAAVETINSGKGGKKLPSWWKA